LLSQLPGNTWHIRWGPCEYVSIVSEETGEREFLFLLEVVADDHRLGWVSNAEVDLLRHRCGIQGGLGAFCSRKVRSVGATFLASATMTVEALKQVFVEAISRASFVTTHLRKYRTIA
jgi:hypothetical protein